jgi:hypothetical protein
VTAATLTEAPARASQVTLPAPWPKPARVLRRGCHEDTVACTGCGSPFLRAKRDTTASCLSCEFDRKLLDAEITADDPGFTRWVTWNELVFAAARSKPTAQAADRAARAAAARGVVAR